MPCGSKVSYEIQINHKDDGKPLIFGSCTLDNANRLRELDPNQAQLELSNKKRVKLGITSQLAEQPIKFDIIDRASIVVLET